MKPASKRKQFDRFSIEVPATADRLDVLLALNTRFTAENRIDHKVEYRTALVIEELFANVLNHGKRADRTTPMVKVSFANWPGSTAVIFEDNAQAYNPLVTPPPKLDGGVEDRPVGGLGVYLIQQMTDKATYRRIRGRNRLTFFVPHNPKYLED